MKIVVVDSMSQPKQGSSVTEKRVRDASGRSRIMRTIDIDSATFATDVEYVFGKNVAKARRENRKIVGAADIAVAKS